MKPATLLYRCRCCGKEFAGVHVPDLMLAVNACEDGTPPPKDWFGFPLSKWTIHQCTRRFAGIADLVGAEEDR